MPRQTFATREFFVEACEAAAHEAIMALPYYFNRLRFLERNEKLHSLIFFYEPTEAYQPVHISISLLYFNDSHSKVTVHGSYTSKCAFSKDPYITAAVANVEAALHAAVSGNGALFEPVVPKKKLTQRCQNVKQATTGFISNTLKSRRFFKTSHS